MDTIKKADAIIREAVAVHNPSHVFALFSGGHDSLCLTHVAMRHSVNAVVHVNTGIGIEQTRTFVRDTCAEQGWPLLELHPPNLSYEEMVLKHGFPGPGGHLYPYVWLKDRALRKLVREHRIGKRTVMFLTGVRSQESERRMGHVEPIFREPKSRVVWVAPLADWSAREVGGYIANAGLKRSPVVDWLHMSGECLCGAFAHPGELEEVAALYPEVVQRIRALERKAAAAGVHSVWGTRPPKFYTEVRRGQLFMPLCWSCTRNDEGAA